MIKPNVKEATETIACLIIDDPLLKPQYGYLNYKKLLNEMKDHNFFTEIAFIPWNYRRSDPKTIQLLADNTDYFRICVHGCNHTANEFGGDDYQKLSELSATALWRMEQHQKLTGLSYDPVMVFPQGVFSSVAIQALKDQGYLAAFNSTLRATDRDKLPALEYQKPYTTVYHDFPFFLRRYPKNRSGFIKDLDSGRPIIIVEHHGSFKNGYKSITNFIDWVNGFGQIKWKPLSYIVEHYCGFKATSFPHKMPSSVTSSVWNETKVALRRFASEVRDNYVEKSNILNKVYKKIRG